MSEKMNENYLAELEEKIEEQQAEYEISETAVKQLHNEKKIVMRKYDNQIVAKQMTARNKRKAVMASTNEHKAIVLQQFQGSNPQVDLGELITSYPKPWAVPNCLGANMRKDLEAKGADYVWTKYGYAEGEGIRLEELRLVVTQSEVKATKENIGTLVARLLQDNLHYQLRGDLVGTLRKLSNYEAIKSMKQMVMGNRGKLAEEALPQTITKGGYQLTVTEKEVIDRGNTVAVFEVHLQPTEEAN